MLSLDLTNNQGNIDFKHIDKNDLLTPAKYIANKINDNLIRGNNIVWFVSGGSNIQLAVAARKRLHLNEKSELHICLVDERFGPVGHKDSNWQQLIQAGFDVNGLFYHQILTDNNKIKDANEEYNLTIGQLLNHADYVIGQFGLGKDGHTAGLVPDNPLMQSHEYYGYYTAKDFERITLTPKIIPELDEAVLFASGETKQKAMHDLIDNGIIEEVPARILLNSKRLTIFSDVI